MTEHLTKEQISVFQETFAIFAAPDKYGYEIITTRGLRKVLQCLGITPTELELKEMVDEVDIDDDGKINCDEFLIIMGKKMKQTDRKKGCIKDGCTNDSCIKETFGIFDDFGNGFVSKAELRNVMINLGERLKDEELDEMIKVADIDLDGRVNYEEFIKVITK